MDERLRTDVPVVAGEAGSDNRDEHLRHCMCFSRLRARSAAVSARSRIMRLAPTLSAGLQEHVHERQAQRDPHRFPSGR